MKYFIQNKGEVSLTDKNFLAQGGEGSIYILGKTAYKIYTDPSKMISVGKIQELSVLNNGNIIKPLDVITNSRKHPVGYTMRYVDNTYSLMQIFPKIFRDRNKLSQNNVLDLVVKFQDLVKSVHDQNVLVVDLNEMNFLCSKDFKDIFAIDVDSWQTKSFPATAIMESIRDRHNKTFSKLTDWFSFAIVSCEMFIGLHPYKGKHPSIKDWNERMEKNISIFNKDVSVPAACLPFTTIPDVYRQWYKALFEDGKRLPPPDSLVAVLSLQPVVTTVVTSISGLFDVKEEMEYDGDIVDVKFYDKRTVLTTDGLYIGRAKYSEVHPNSKLIITDKSNRIIAVNIEKGILKLDEPTHSNELQCTLACSDLFEYDNRLYVKSGSNIIEVKIKEICDLLLPTFEIVGQVLENSSKCFDGVVIQNMIGAFYASIFPSSGNCLQIKIDELAHHRIIDAKYDSGVLMVVGHKQGKDYRFIFKVNETDSTYIMFKKEDDITYNGLNFVTLDSGICVGLNDEDEKLELFNKSFASSVIKVLDDKYLSNDMKLFKYGVKMYFAKKNKLYSFSMKAK